MENNNKKVALHAHSFLKGTPAVHRYYNDDETKQIDILTCKADSQGLYECLATIGLSQHDIELTSDFQPLRVELLCLLPLHSHGWENILATAAFHIMDLHYCRYGMIINNAVVDYLGEVNCPHIVLMRPVFWKVQSLKLLDYTVTWLLAIPITHKESEFIQKQGIEAFDQLMSEKQLDILDMQRDSLI